MADHVPLPEAGPAYNAPRYLGHPMDGCWAVPKGRWDRKPCGEAEVNDVGLCEKHLDEIKGEDER